MKKHTNEPKRNVIMMISDGFGPASETFARQYYRWREDLPVNAIFPLDKILVGTSRTQSSSSLITDSAAGATAFSCAIKTYNGAIGVNPDEAPCGTVLESAKVHRNMKTGLVVKSRVTHATPAAFSAHIGWRDWENQIAEHQVGYTPLGRTVDLMFGGGLCEFLSNNTAESCRLDNRNLIGDAKRDYGWDTITTRQQFDQLDPKNVELPLMGLFAPHHMDYAIDNKPSIQPSLPEMAGKALDILKESIKDSKEGFFLMVEASRIDMAGHINDPATQFEEVWEYQQTIELLMKFVEQNPETVLIATSDHETGGLTVGRQVTKEYPEYEWNPEVLIKVKNSSEILAWKWMQAISEGKDTREYLIEVIIKDGTGVEDASDAEINQLLAWKENNLTYEFFAKALADIISKRAEIGWTTMGHTAVDVNLYAYGSKSESLRGNHENTDIGAFIVNYLNLDLDDITKRLNCDHNFVSGLKRQKDIASMKKLKHYIQDI
ncbi:alkaline-phosphatase-like protein [Parasitella parasitica]|nr:alkaline-phosphatase-like protein [Parasitella parasitica]